MNVLYCGFQVGQEPPTQVKTLQAHDFYLRIDAYKLSFVELFHLFFFPRCFFELLVIQLLFAKKKNISASTFVFFFLPFHLLVNIRMKIPCIHHSS